MTIQEAINLLQSVENKSQELFMCTDGYHFKSPDAKESIVWEMGKQLLPDGKLTESSTCFVLMPEGLVKKMSQQA